MIKIRLSRLLGDLQMTQSDLAKKTGIRKATVHEMYHDLVERVNLDYLSRICKVLDCKIEDILEYLPDEVHQHQRKKKREKKQKLNNN